jgi:hypothetical protein
MMTKKKQLSLLVEVDPKGLRETLCEAQALINQWMPMGTSPSIHSDRLQLLISECDRHRPLGPDGKHGDLHTATCGCVDHEEDPMNSIREYFFEGEVTLVEAYRMYMYSQGESFVYPPEVETLKKFHEEHILVAE